MRLLRYCWNRTWRRLGSDADLSAEIQSHIDMQTEENVRAGMLPEEARRKAVARFGAVEAVKEAYRDQRGWSLLEGLLKDVRYAARGLCHRPMFTAVAALSVGLGVGVNTTVFSWLKAVYLTPVPGVADARDLVTVNASYKRGGGFSNSVADYEYLRDHSRSFAAVAAHEMLFASISDGSTSEKLGGGYVSSNYFEVLGVQPVLGRLFATERHEPVIVLSHTFWQRRFAADPGILGSRVLLNRKPYTIVGVAAPEFRGIYGGIAQDFWVPSADYPWFQIVGRPQANTTLEVIQAELDVLSAQARTLHHKNSPDYRAIANPLHRAERGYHAGIFGMVRVLGVAAGLVLLLACINVAGMLLSRANDRFREITIRFSLGASRIRIARQLFIESCLLAAIGGMVALLLAVTTQRLPDVLSQSGFELVLNSTFDWRVAAFLFLASAFSVLLFGLTPAIIASGQTGANTSVTRKRSRLRGALVASQVALSATTLTGAALVGDSLYRLMSADKGFEPAGVLTAEIDAASAGLEPQRGQRMYRAVRDRLRASPGITDVAWTTFLPMSGSGGGNHRSITVRGYTPPDGREQNVIVDAVSPSYLRTLRIPLLAGREFSDSDDDQSARVMLCNEKFVEEYLAGRDPIGVQVKVDDSWRTIIGVHRNYTYRHPGNPSSPAVLLPMAQDYAPAAIVVVRTTGDPATAAPLIRSASAAFHPEIAVARILTMEQNVATMFLGERIITGVLAAFGFLCCLLAAIGLYGLLDSYVNARRREFGIRTAVGATRSQLCSLVVRHSARLTLLGGVLGLALSVGAARLLRASLSTITSDNPLIYVVAAGGVAITALIASGPPLRRAAATNPAEALRHD